MHCPYRQWNPGPARKNDTQIIPAACGLLHAVILQEAGDHAPHISENFYTYTDGNDLAILLNKDTFVSGAAVFAISEASTCTDKWGIAALVVRGLLRRPSVVDSLTVTFCSAHLRGKVAEKRDASIFLLQCLREHVIHHSVDFIGGDFNMSTFSAVGDVFSDPDETCRECTSFTIMPRHPHTWRVHPHGCDKFDIADMGSGPRDLTAHFL